MDRDEFMEIVYETFADEPDNVLANGIIEAADAYVEHEKAQLSQEDATFDLIDRQQAIDALDFEIVHMIAYCDGENEGNPLAQYNKGLEDGKKAIEALPPAQPEPKEGHWKKDESDDCPIVFQQFRICSVCGTIEMSETNYCPNCGAKMKGVRQK